MRSLKTSLSPDTGCRLLTRLARAIANAALGFALDIEHVGLSVAVAPIGAVNLTRSLIG